MLSVVTATLVPPNVDPLHYERPSNKGEDS